MAKFCGKCGARLDERTGLCPNCDRSKLLHDQTANRKFEIDRSSIPEIQKTVSTSENRQTESASGKIWKRLLPAFVAFILILGGSLAVLSYFDLIEIPFLSASRDVRRGEQASLEKESVLQGEDGEPGQSSNLGEEFFGPSMTDTDSDNSSSILPVSAEPASDPTPAPTSPPTSSPEPTATPTPTPDPVVPKSNRQILPDSSTRYLTEYDVAGLSDAELTIARNEIYARRGRKFNDTDLRSYFESQSWYSGTIEPADFTESMLSEIERANVQFIKNHEASSHELVSSTNGQIFPESSIRYLTASDLQEKSKWELEVGRNEIYARHGRKFNTVSLKEYFEAQSWYRGTIDPENFSEDMLNDIEKANIGFIKGYE